MSQDFWIIVSVLLWTALIVMIVAAFLAGTYIVWTEEEEDKARRARE